MFDNEIYSDDASNGIYYFEEDGILKSVQAELILETYKGIQSKRLYRLSEEGRTDFFMFAHKNLEGIECPNCKEKIHIEEGYLEQDHQNDCDYRFDTNELLKAIEEKNKECNKWWWINHPYHKLEAALLNLFERLSIEKKPSFKALKKDIRKEEDRISKQLDPHHQTEREIDRLYKKMKKEEKRFGKPY